VTGTVPEPGRDEPRTSLAGKAAIVTGASRGIGLDIARTLLRRGAQVCLTARHAEGLRRAVSELGGPPHVIAVAGHVDDPGHRERAVARTVEAFGAVDLLVNNAAVNPVLGPVLELEQRAIDKIMAVNVLAPLFWIRQAVAAGLGRRGGAVVTVGSVAALRAAPGVGMYGVSKAAAVRLVQELAVELAPDIRVNAVLPAVVETHMSAVLRDGDADPAARYPLRRLGETRDVASAVAFLLSDESAWITGSVLVVDGGLTLGGLA
jgi:NAD(P)-dependent dehydrogenase (short-subunit alcohol dehydrogenase family)